MTKLTEEMVFARTKGNDLGSVKKLNCWGIELSDVSIIRQMKSVEVLALSVNNIRTLSDFQYCVNLQELYIRKNKIKNIEEICYLRDLPKLRSLWLDDNPCAVVENYRNIVILNLPQLEKLDNIAIDVADRDLAKSYGVPLYHPREQTRICDVRANSAEHHLERRGSQGNSDAQNHNSHIPRSESDYFAEQLNRLRMREEENCSEHNSHATSDSKSTRYRYHQQEGFAHRAPQPPRSLTCPRTPSDGPNEEIHPAIENNYAAAQSQEYYVPREYQQPSPPPYDDGENQNVYSRDIREYPVAERKAQITQLFFEEGMGPSRVEDVDEVFECIERDYPSTTPTQLQSHSPPQLQSQPHTPHQHVYQQPIHQPTARIRNRHSNILSAVLSLIKELDYPHLEVVETAVQSRMQDFD